MEKNNQGQAGRNNALCVPEISQEMHSVQFQISKGPLFCHCLVHKRSNSTNFLLECEYKLLQKLFTSQFYDILVLLKFSLFFQCLVRLMFRLQEKVLGKQFHQW